MKFYSTIFLLATLHISSAWSAGIIDPTRVTLETSPYPACKDVKLLTEKDYKQNTAYWNKRCNNGAEAIQILPKTGKFITDVANPIASLSILLSVGEKARKEIADNISKKEKILNCLNASKPSADCDNALKNELDSVYKNLDELKIELALTEGHDPEMVGKIRGMGGHAEFPKISEMINPSLKKSFLGTSGVFRPDDLPALTEAEKQKAESRMQKNVDEIQSDKKIDSESKKISAFQQVRATHKVEYLKLLQASPVLAVLGKLPDRRDPAEVKKVFSKAYKELIKFAKAEQVTMAVKWDHASLEPPRGASRGFRAKGENNRAKELLSFMSYTPIVDQVIKEQMKTNPTICAQATALYQAMENQEFRSGLVTGGAVVTGAVVITVLTGGTAALVAPEALPVVGGMALSSQTAVALAMGPGIGYLTRLDAEHDLKQSKGALAGGVIDAKKVDQVETGVVIGNATMGLDFVGTGLLKGTGNAIYKTIAKKSLMAEGNLSAVEAEKLITIAASTEPAKQELAQEAKKKINETISKKIKKIFPQSEPSAEELEALNVIEAIGPEKKEESLKDFFNRVQKISDNQEKKKVLKDAIVLFKALNPEKYKNATEQELKDLNKQVVAISRYGKVENPEKIVAILSSWDENAKNKLASVYEGAQKILDDKNFMKGKSLRERRELAFKKELENKGVKDPKQRDMMCICPDACGGGMKVSLNDIGTEKLKSLHVCSANNNTLWYINPKLKIGVKSI